MDTLSTRIVWLASLPALQHIASGRASMPSVGWSQLDLHDCLCSIRVSCQLPALSLHTTRRSRPDQLSATRVCQERQ
ncbi:hypothetical protein BC831DRAFT_474464 [Entophlyctis helioformis]|nr:hypothetical protein BC831DRAFT_474464 [Entophlyctis helioformis]